MLPLLQRLRDSLLKIYADKSLTIELAVDPQCRFRGDERDLLEIAGNILDNACKYGRGRVWVRTEGGAPGLLTLVVEDDGAGIPAAEHRHILRRGARLDERGPGQGLGLAVATDIIASYHGSLNIGARPGGGTRVTIRLP